MDISPEVWIALGVTALGNFWLIARTVGDRDRRLRTAEKELAIIRKNVHLNNNTMHEFLLKYDADMVDDYRGKLRKLLEERDINGKD